MDDSILYPQQTLESSGTIQQRRLQEAWQTHLLLLHQQILQPAAQLGDQVGEPFRQYISTWHRNLERGYTALSAFARLLESGGKEIEQLDVATSRAFEPSSEAE
ncbi:hypothetical protein [Thermogemmatispora sp.]|uniref:hypothetical protein n=1 Tax=Thermogemmatispora sp. TaxID=1968838 RepID=UPI0035E410A3